MSRKQNHSRGHQNGGVPVSENRISFTSAGPDQSSEESAASTRRALPAPGSEVPGFAQVITRYPLASVLGGFGIGFGLGVLGVALLAEREDERWPKKPRRWLESHGMPGSMHELTSNLERVRDSIAKHLPDALYRG